MNRYLIIVFAFTFSIPVLGQKVGVKYGMLGSNQRISYNNNRSWGSSIMSGYLGVEYEITHRRPQIRLKTNSGNRLSQLFWIFELAYSQKGVNGLLIGKIPEQVRLDYFTFSPRIKLFDFPRKAQNCRVYGCCDYVDYGKVKPYFNLYLGPKIDYLINSNFKSRELNSCISGAIVSLNTQIICMNSGSIFTDFQLGYDFNNALIRDNLSLKNYSILIAMGFKIRNTNNY